VILQADEADPLSAVVLLWLMTFFVS